MESKKKGLAVTAVVGLLAYQPKTWQEISVAVLVTIIVMYAINRQANIDNGKNSVDNNDKP